MKKPTESEIEQFNKMIVDSNWDHPCENECIYHKLGYHSANADEDWNKEFWEKEKKTNPCAKSDCKYWNSAHS